METVNQIEYNGALYNVQDTEAQKSLVYSQNETDTGMIWINGKKIYRNVINYGVLPNNTTVRKEHNIQDMDEIVSAKGITFLSSGGFYLPIPYVLDITGNIGLAISKTQISITTFANRTDCINSYIIIEYTKTTN